MRDESDDYRLFVSLFSQLDFKNFLGPGVADTNLKSTLFFRRLRPELGGELFGKFQFLIAGDWGATSLDNPAGTVSTSAAPPGASPTATSGRYASAQSVGVRSGPADAYLNAEVAPSVNLQVGQFDVPFTLERRTSFKATPFLERSLVTRSSGTSSDKDLGFMVWGEALESRLDYAVGLFSGDGQNRPNVDNRFDWAGRVYGRPLLGKEKFAASPLKNLQVGMSLRYGQRDPYYVAYDYAPMTTQGDFAFWSPVYKGANGYTHILPSGSQVGVAAEVRVPLEKFDVTSELLYIHNNTREAIEGYQLTNTERLGAMKGVGYYVQVGYWPMGNRDLNGMPGVQRPARLDMKAPHEAPKRAVQLLAKWEQIRFQYDSASRAGTADTKNIDGAIKVDVFSLGANYWLTKHLRFSANYGFNMFPGSAPVAPSFAGHAGQSSEQRAVAPANLLAKTVNPDARDTAHSLHEVAFRAAVAF